MATITSDEKISTPFTPRLMQFMLGFQATQVANTLLRLGVDDILSRGSHPVSEIAKAVDASADGLVRLLRGAAALDLVRETEQEHFELTAFGAELHANRDMAAFLGDPAMYLVNSRMSDAVRSGRPVARDVLG
ncbi:MAG: methyltransferase family protein, partial [Candidatus Dormibacteraceae bacterium]